MRTLSKAIRSLFRYQLEPDRNLPIILLGDGVPDRNWIWQDLSLLELTRVVNFMVDEGIAASGWVSREAYVLEPHAISLSNYVTGHQWYCALTHSEYMRMRVFVQELSSFEWSD